ncbi:MAG: SDR family oxidoreductase [Rhodococcus sp. (in: high G+C Gram-positive bacteria)]
MSEFEGKSVLVTGGGSGIGLGIATALANAGAAVTIVGRTDSKLDDAAHASTLRPFASDVTDEVAVVRGGGPILDDYMTCTPLARVGEVENIAALALFLLGPASSWITGQVVNVDGGHMLRRGPDYTSMLEQVFGPNGLRGVVE